MDWRTVIQNIDAGTARAFVSAARHLIDALLIEAERSRATQTPAARDYESATLARTAPPDGWLSPDALRATAQRMSEALTAEKWMDGFLAALKALGALGGSL
jgi:hypothetical protein